MHPPFFSSSFGSTAGAEFFVKTAKNGFGSPVWLTAVDVLNWSNMAACLSDFGIEKSILLLVLVWLCISSPEIQLS